MAALLTSISNRRRKGEVGRPFVTCVNLLNFERFRQKKSSNYCGCEMQICFQIECCLWEQFSFRESRLPLVHISHMLLSKCLLVNNSDTPSYHLSLNDSNGMEHMKSEMIRQKENNHGRLTQNKNKQDDAIYRLPSFFLLSTTRAAG